MAIYHPYKIKCPACESAFMAQLARGINISRTPGLKQKIIDGTFHRVTCPNCKTTFTVEKEFSYTDFNSNLFIKVKPRQERHLWKEASYALSDEIERIPELLSESSSRKLRIVFGLAELREKIIAQEHNLDDRMVELMKVLLIHDHPVIIQRPRVRILLDRIESTSIQFIAVYDHNNRSFRLTIARWLVDNFLSKPEEIKKWVQDAHKRENLFELKDDHWVNFWRWSPQPTALELLRSFSVEVERGNNIDTQSESFRRMIAYIPKGSQLPAWGKKDLNTLFNYAKANNLQQLQDTLFEIRFDKALEDDWYLNNDPDDIDTIWKLLSNLPETNVDGNTFIQEILLNNGEGGGAYDPRSRDIYIGSDELNDQERFEDVVRHEVGHAVHEKFKQQIDNWLATRFGWQTLEISDANIDSWIVQMGGWGTITASQQAQIRNYLAQAIGNGGSWIAGRLPFIPADHPWNSADFGPRLAYEKTGDYWFLNYKKWHKANGKVFFLNYWYRTLCIVSEESLKLVEKMPSNYASMSHFEFFAELYALYYDRDDRMRKDIPADVTKWFEDNIGIQAKQPVMPQFIPERKSFDWVKRPQEQ